MRIKKTRDRFNHLVENKVPDALPRPTYDELVELLTSVANKVLYEPDCDVRECCRGCGASGRHGHYNHTDECLVIWVHKTLAKAGR